MSSTERETRSTRDHAMNCLEFRRHIAAEPDSARADLAGHRESCPRCAQAYGDALAFEAKLRHALAVPAPADLAQRVLLRQTTAARTDEHRGRRFTALRIAAALVLAIGAAGVFMMLRNARPLPDLAVAHLAHEPYALSSRARVPLAQLRTAFAHEGVALAADPGSVDYFNECSLGGEPMLHMVVQTAEGPVTVYYVPGRGEPARAVWEREGVMGRTVPAGGGTLVLLASHDTQFDALERRWRSALDTVPGQALGQR